MINRMMNAIAQAGMKWCKKRGKEILITGTADSKDVYLVRYPLVNTPLFSVYIHQFLRSDHDDHHDHPFSFVSYIIKGGYTEERLHPAAYKNLRDFYKNAGIIADFHTITERREAGSLAYRSAPSIHRVIVDKALTYEEKDQAPLTIIAFLGRVRSWGFWKKIDQPNRRQFVHFREYLKKPSKT